LKTELEELRYRLATAAYLIRIRLGMFDKATLDWLRPIVKAYKGLNASEELVAAIERMSALPDEQIRAIAEVQSASADSALALKKYAAPLLDSKFALVSSLEPVLQNRLYEIRVHLSLFNEDVDQARYYFQQTFNSSISEVNHDRAVQNLNGCHKSAALRAKEIVDHIGKIEW
jgi:hypothetical protein